MVAKITNPHSIKRALNYNEKKVQNGHASCIHANNFLKNLDKLNFYDKLQRFQDLISLNDRAQKSNTLHISLNFHPSENLNQKTLCAIANEFMERIGFREQPYLVYEHQDAGHPHIHIVTTNIEASGKRIDTYNIGKLKSEIARKEIEMKFGLVRATDGIRIGSNKIDIRKVEYGKVETKRAITNVLDSVINHYNFNSLASLNAILKTFNVLADRGQEGGRIHKFKGLLYYILDPNGRKVSVPIKASLIHSNPTLGNLENLFKANEEKRVSPRLKLKNRINSVLDSGLENMTDFTAALKKCDIDVVFRQNESGFTYGVTFVDHINKSVFNGSELGKEFSVAAIQKLFEQPETIEHLISKNNAEHPLKPRLLKKIKGKTMGVAKSPRGTEDNILKELLKAGQDDPRLLYPLLVKRRKKKRKLLL